MSISYVVVHLENTFNGDTTELWLETEDLNKSLDCNSELQFRHITEIESITEEEYYEHERGVR